MQTPDGGMARVRCPAPARARQERESDMNPSVRRDRWSARAGRRQLDKRSSEKQVTYLERLRQAHRIEVNGEAVYATAARRTSRPDRQAKWQALEQLESQMKQQLAAAIEREGTTASERAVDVLLGQAVGIAAAGIPWGITLRVLGIVTRHTTRFWERLEREHAGRDAALLARLVAHERAQSEFVQLELHGQGERSTAPVLALLRDSRSGK